MEGLFFWCQATASGQPPKNVIKFWKYLGNYYENTIVFLKLIIVTFGKRHYVLGFADYGKYKSLIWMFPISGLNKL